MYTPLRSNVGGRLEELLEDVRKNVGKKPIAIIIGEIHPTNYTVTEIIKSRKKGLPRVNLKMAHKVKQIEGKILKKILKISGRKALYLECGVEDNLGNLLGKFDGVYRMDENNEYYKVIKEVLINVYKIYLELAPLYRENRDVEKRFEKIRESLEEIQKIFEEKGILNEEIEIGDVGIPMEVFFIIGFDKIRDLSRGKNVKNFEEELKFLERLVLHLFEYVFEKYNPGREKYWIDLINKDKYDIKVIIVGKKHISSLEEALRGKYITYTIDIEELLKTSS